LSYRGALFGLQVMF